MMSSVQGEGFNYMSLVPFVLIFVVMYFLLIRPQQKRVRQQQDMLKSIVKGDKVLTSGGIIATVLKVVNDQELEVEISEGVKVRLMRSMVADVLNRSSNLAPREGISSSDKKEDTKVKKLASKKSQKQEKKK
ncbi:MAG: preprotein translocase subunit YajC [Proteobacteria bacterium]|nr:preprotein translocase subunit YajC [Pseudomonadota bacterium]